MKIKFCGAARQVTGSSHLITLDDGYKILLDCGLFQGKGKDTWSNNNKWWFDPKEIDCMILSHSHIDHCGRIPQLVKDGYSGPIYSTHATRSLCAIMLLDSAKIQERDVEWYNRKILKKKKRNRKGATTRRPLYTSDDVSPAMDHFIGYPYDKKFKIRDNVELEFRDAGHILGSASVTLCIQNGDKQTRIGFTGDVGRPNRPILRDPDRMDDVDYLICESTYGAKDHELPPEQSLNFLECIKHTCVEKKGKLIIPAFSVGRTQEIVYMMDKLEQAKKLPKLPVYVDSPLAVNATQVFGSHPECFDNKLNEYLLIDDDPFGFNSLKYIRKVEESKALNSSKEPAVIISSSGMMNAGRVRHHLYNNIEDPKNTFLIVGYCSPDTAGGMLRNGIEQLKVFGDVLNVNAEIKVMDSFSAHADRTELIDFMSNQKSKVRKLFLVHGENESQKVFRKQLLGEGFNDVVIPDLGQEVEIEA